MSDTVTANRLAYIQIEDAHRVMGEPEQGEFWSRLRLPSGTPLRVMDQTRLFYAVDLGGADVDEVVHLEVAHGVRLDPVSDWDTAILLRNAAAQCVEHLAGEIPRCATPEASALMANVLMEHVAALKYWAARLAPDTDDAQSRPTRRWVSPSWQRPT